MEARRRQGRILLKVSEGTLPCWNPEFKNSRIQGCSFKNCQRLISFYFVFLPITIYPPCTPPPPTYIFVLSHPVCNHTWESNTPPFPWSLPWSSSWSALSLLNSHSTYISFKPLFPFFLFMFTSLPPMNEFTERQKLITHQLYTSFNAGRQSTYTDYTN